jgi:primary-amine oxidase
MDHPVQTASLTDAISEVAHPLDPLSAREIARATATIRAHFTWGDDLRVETIDIEEPTKEFVRNHVQGTPFPRIARFNIYRRGEMGVWQGRTDLASGEVIAKTFRADARAMVAVEEVLLIEQTVKADPRFQEALRRRGLLGEVDNMCIDPWTVGQFFFEEEQGRRVLNCFVWMRAFPLDNYYAHPVEKLLALIDLSTLENPARR